jgi:hypothetical protein
MKNCELNIRKIDEGAMDEKSGMNFSEYIAILSGDTSLLEKANWKKRWPCSKVYVPLISGKSTVLKGRLSICK